MEGFAADPMFDNYRFDDLSTTQLRVALKVGEKKQGGMISVAVGVPCHRTL